MRRGLGWGEKLICHYESVENKGLVCNFQAVQNLSSLSIRIMSFSVLFFCEQKERKRTKRKEKARFFAVSNDDINRRYASSFELGIIVLIYAIVNSVRRRLTPPKPIIKSVFSFSLWIFLFLLLAIKEKEIFKLFRIYPVN